MSRFLPSRPAFGEKKYAYLSHLLVPAAARKWSRKLCQSPFLLRRLPFGEMQRQELQQELTQEFSRLLLEVLQKDPYLPERATEMGEVPYYKQRLYWKIQDMMGTPRPGVPRYKRFKLAQQAFNELELEQTIHRDSRQHNITDEEVLHLVREKVIKRRTQKNLSLEPEKIEKIAKSQLASFKRSQQMPDVLTESSVSARASRSGEDEDEDLFNIDRMPAQALRSSEHNVPTQKPAPLVGRWKAKQESAQPALFVHPVMIIYFVESLDLEPATTPKAQILFYHRFQVEGRISADEYAALLQYSFKKVQNVALSESELQSFETQTADLRSRFLDFLKEQGKNASDQNEASQ